MVTALLAGGKTCNKQIDEVRPSIFSISKAAPSSIQHSGMPVYILL